MDDPISRIEAALKAEPSAGPWTVLPAIAGEQCVARINALEVVPPTGIELARDFIDADYIAACNPVAIRALLDRLKAAEAEVAEQARLLGISGSVEARLLAMVEELERDAARYRWLRGDSRHEYSDRWTQWEIRCWRAPFWTTDLRHERLDDAIDAAMRKEGGE